MSIRIRPRAEQDIWAVAGLINHDRPSAADEFLDRLSGTLELLERFPLMGSKPPTRGLARAGLKVFRVKKFRNYIILYRPAPGGVDVLRIVDGRRDLPTVLTDELD